MISATELIEKFHDSVSDEFPEISLEEMKLICRAPFQMMKKVIQEGKLESIRLQYLFVVKVSESRVIKNLTMLKKYKHKYSPEDYVKYMEKFLNYIDNNKNKFKKYEERIRNITGESRE